MFSPNKNREFKLKYLRKLFDNNNILCLQEVRGKTRISRLFRCRLRGFVFFGTFIPGNENARRSAFSIHRDIQLELAIVTLGYVSRPWSLCEHTIWATQSRHCQRSFRTRTYFESITWQITSYSPALAFISQWSGHYCWVTSTPLI